MNRWSPVAIAAGASALGAASLLAIFCHLVTFALSASTETGMTGSWSPGKLMVLAVCYLAVSLGLAGASWSMSRSSSTQRSLVREWSPATILVLTGTLTFIFAIYYPLPYYNHHADKLYLLLALLLTWTVWFL